MSFLGTASDDDEISVFVQDIDSRKPLRGRLKQLEMFDNVADPSWKSKQGQGHDRETTDRRKLRRTSGTPLDAHLLPMERAVSLPSEMHPSSVATEVASSTSPPRGLMLTNQGEIDERLSKMKETFLRSLEGLGGGGNGPRRKEKEKEKSSPTATSSSSKTSSTVTPFERTSINDSPPPGSSSGHDNSSLASRGMNLGYGFSSREQPLEYGYSPSGLGLGIRRGRYASTSSSILGSSDVAGMSQGSEEVIGRMDLYDERRTGYQG